MSNSFFPRGVSSNDLEIQCASTFVLHPLSTRLPGHCSRKRNGWIFMQGLFTALGSKKKKRKSHFQLHSTGQKWLMAPLMVKWWEVSFPVCTGNRDELNNDDH